MSDEESRNEVTKTIRSLRGSLSDTLQTGLAVLAGYFLTYNYFKGYFSFFGIPPELIDVQLQNVLFFMVAAAFSFYLLTSIVFDFWTQRFEHPDLNDPVVKIVILFLIGFCLLSFFLRSWVIFLIGLVSTVLLIVFIVVVFIISSIRWSRKFSKHLVEAANSGENDSFDQLVDKACLRTREEISPAETESFFSLLLGREMWVAFVFIFLTGFLSSVVGYVHASSIFIFRVCDHENGAFLLVDETWAGLICAGVDLDEKQLTGKFVVIPHSNTPIFETVRIDDLQSSPKIRKVDTSLEKPLVQDSSASSMPETYSTEIQGATKTSDATGEAGK